MYIENKFLDIIKYYFNFFQYLKFKYTFLFIKISKFK